MVRGLRFCMVTTFYPPFHFGGDAVNVYRLSQALAERGHRVDVVHSLDAYRLHHDGEPEVAFEHHPNVTVHPLTTRRGVASALAAHQLGRPVRYATALREILEGGGHDVIHFHNISLIGGPKVLELGRAVKLYTAHEYWLVCPTHVLYKFDREACTERRCLTCTVVHYHRPPQVWRRTGSLPSALRHVDRLIVPSRFALRKHRELGVDRPMVHLPFFVPRLANDAEPGGDRHGIELPERPFFLYVGRLERLKGVHDLLDVFDGYHEADLVVAGAGEREAELRARGLPNVHFAGQLHPESLGSLYDRAIAVLVPSRCYEAFGLTLAESLTRGTPVIARRIGALTEHIEQTGGGILFDDLDGCRRAMDLLRLDPGRRAALGQRGRLAAQGLWSPDRHIEAYLDLVEGVWRRSPTPPLAVG